MPNVHQPVQNSLPAGGGQVPLTGRMERHGRIGSSWILQCSSVQSGSDPQTLRWTTLLVFSPADRIRLWYTEKIRVHTINYYAPPPQGGALVTVVCLSVCLSFSCLTLSRQEAQLMLTTGAMRFAVSRGQQTWYHFGSVATFR